MSAEQLPGVAYTVQFSPCTYLQCWRISCIICDADNRSVTKRESQETRPQHWTALAFLHTLRVSAVASDENLSKIVA